jgi:hypothetical protein
VDLQVFDSDQTHEAPKLRHSGTLSRSGFSGTQKGEASDVMPVLRLRFRVVRPRHPRLCSGRCVR